MRTRWFYLIILFVPFFLVGCNLTKSDIETNNSNLSDPSVVSNIDNNTNDQYQSNPYDSILYSTIESKKQTIADILYIKYEEWTEFGKQEMSIPQATVYIAFADITEDNIPEFFCGMLDNLGTIEYSCYDLSTVQLQEIKLCFTGSLSGDFLCGKRYINNKGETYYASVAEWGPITQGYFVYSDFSYNEEEQQWFINVNKYEDVNRENHYSVEDFYPLDESIPMAVSTSELSMDIFNGQKVLDEIENCMMQYFHNSSCLS